VIDAGEGLAGDRVLVLIRKSRGEDVGAVQERLRRADLPGLFQRTCALLDTFTPA